jgi:pimeloyl-ACP methyl ester carboxylesterase
MKKLGAIWRQRIRFFRLEHFTRLHEKDFTTIQSKKTPVVLVAGIYAGGRSLLPLKKFLESQNYPVYLAPEKQNYEAVSILAKRLEKQIQKISDPKIQIMAHSMGGITVLQALQNPKIFAKVTQVITLGSPLNGCLLGSLAFLERRRNQKYLALNSQAIKKLNSNLKINCKIRVLWAAFDEIVFPKKSIKLRGAKENAELPVYGHTGLILAKKSWQEILKRLVK